MSTIDRIFAAYEAIEKPKCKPSALPAPVTAVSYFSRAAPMRKISYSSGGAKGSRSSDVRTCYRCGEAGHVSRNCPMASARPTAGAAAGANYCTSCRGPCLYNSPVGTAEERVEVITENKMPTRKLVTSNWGPLLKAGPSAPPAPKIELAESRIVATKRLQRDLKDVAQNPLACVTASPAGDNLFEWHANIRAPTGAGHPLEGVVLHMVLTFPEQYPRSPPHIRLCTALDHASVLDNGDICMDMLEQDVWVKGTEQSENWSSEGNKWALYTGWSSAYSVQSVLLQLQAFLLEGASLDAASVANARSSAMSYECPCGHRGSGKISPVFARDAAMPGVATEEMSLPAKKKKQKRATSPPGPSSTASASAPSSGPSSKPPTPGSAEWVSQRRATLQAMPTEILVATMEFLGQEDLEKAAESAVLTTAAEDVLIRKWLHKDLVCFHSKVSFEEDTLGIGLALEYKMNGKLSYIHTPLDFMSRTAFEVEGVRKSVWKEPFTHFLPLRICPEHATSAMPLAEQAIATVCNKPRFTPGLVLEVLPKLMNTMVVNVMSGDCHASIKALEGYSAFVHLFIAFCERYPELQAAVEKQIRSFVNGERRSKEDVPALGDFIALLAVSKKYEWADVAQSYLSENFDRNVLWVLKKYPSLARKWVPNDERIEKTFDACTVSLRLAMFHVHFLETFARPEGVPPSAMREQLDTRFGRPTPAMQQALQDEIARIKAVTTYEEFFGRMGIAAPNKTKLVEWLLVSLQNSANKRYHNPRDF